MNNTDIVNQIADYARQAGFDYFGFSPANPINSVTQERFENWIRAGNHASMGYMERNKELRFNPSLLHQGTHTVISLIINYNAKTTSCSGFPMVANYAWGNDYHDLIRRRLKPLQAFLYTLDPEHQPRIFTDSAPVLDRYWAYQAGLGFIGKNTCLIHPKAGSWFFIAHIFTSVKIIADASPINYNCGSCTRCIDACPVNALSIENGLDARKCISYWTIEATDKTPEEISSLNPGWIFGCDICQQVCPYNKKAPISSIPEFVEPRAWHSFDLDSWKSMSETEFNLHFDKSPLKRCGFSRLNANLRNIKD